MSGDDAYPLDLRQRGDSVFNDADREIFLFGIARQIVEWQNRDRGFVRQRWFLVLRFTSLRQPCFAQGVEETIAIFVNPVRKEPIDIPNPGLFTNPLAVDFSACDASLVAGSFAAGESRVLPQLCDSHLRHERREEAAVEASGTATGDPAVA